MKNIITHIIPILLLILTTTTSCNDFLSKTPDDRMEITDLNKVKSMLVPAYPKGNYLFTEWFTDNVDYRVGSNTTPLIENAFYWGDISRYDDVDSPTSYWNSAYNAIAQTNSIFNALRKIKGGDAKLRKSIKGEALLCRAYAHFMLAVLFCKDYNKTKLSQDMGIPYLVKSEDELVETYKRGTLAHTYDMIEKDLTAGLKLVSDDLHKGDQKAFHFNKKSAYLFASRFYLFKKEYQKSIDYVNKIMGGPQIDNRYIKDLQGYSSKLDGSDKAHYYNNTNDASNLLLMEKSQATVLNAGYNYKMSLPKWKKLTSVSIYNRSDLRVAEGSGISMLFYNKYYGATYIQNVFRGEEAIFNRIESYIQLNKYTEALRDINEFCYYRYAGSKKSDIQVNIDQVKMYYKTPDEKEALLKFCLDEKNKEFLTEGMRWLDIRRNSLEVTHVSSDYTKIFLSNNDPRKVLQIPYNASGIGELTKNPRK